MHTICKIYYHPEIMQPYYFFYYFECLNKSNVVVPNVPYINKDNAIIPPLEALRNTICCLMCGASTVVLFNRGMINIRKLDLEPFVCNILYQKLNTCMLIE